MSGQGAYLYGGRWNSPEHRVVYASGNLTLAMLEVLVHIDDAEAFLSKRYVYHSVDFDAADVSVLEASFLPSSWNARPETRTSQTVGDEFLERSEGVVLAVPSVVVPRSLRYDPALHDVPGQPAASRVCAGGCGWGGSRAGLGPTVGLDRYRRQREQGVLPVSLA